jgi:hypothetical protein
LQYEAPIETKVADGVGADEFDAIAVEAEAEASINDSFENYDWADAASSTAEAFTSEVEGESPGVIGDATDEEEFDEPDE